MTVIKLDKENHISTITLNRPEVRNAFNEELMKELYELFSALDQDPDTRVVVLTGAGKSFCAGGDLNYMKSAREKNRDQNIQESLFMAKMFQTIDNLSKPTIALVNGAALGGGVGLVSVCDIVLAHEKAFFSLSEVKLGLNPSVISPFVIQKIGVNQARRFFITGERFDAVKAREIGLVNEVINDDNQSSVLKDIFKQILSNGPNALAQAKVLIEKNKSTSGKDLTQFTAEQIADLRASDEAQEGISCFFDKKKPKYDVSS